MRSSLIILSIIITTAWAFKAATSYADIFRYKDKDGVEHITNDFNQIPPEFREQFIDKSEPEKPREVINAEKELAAAVAVAKTKHTQSTTPADDQDSAGPQTILQRLLALADRYDAKLPAQIAGVILLIIAIFIGGGYLGSALGHKKLAALICFSLAAIILAYLFSVNLQRVSERYHAFVGQVKNLESKLNSKQNDARKNEDIPSEQPHNPDERQLSPIKMPD